MDKSSKGRQVTFEDKEVETDVEEYVAMITEDDIRINSRKEKSHKRPKVTMLKNVSVLVDDENVRRKKMKVEHSQVVISNSEDPSENSKESREIITLGADLEMSLLKQNKMSFE